ncbi:DKNYY domain-containing protein [Chryseobacterium sp.]|uniref:DKNYY domain-containing protein n=1 Tax=Chryseobacterium sp. TaxID=1871047 RepID=UPI0025BD53CF|nr:DKNYY domain-containing protein [Chryseobacterium sp.]MBV8325896.1 DKNYY domain-containing protein [Chryseobacterium sp.]
MENTKEIVLVILVFLFLGCDSQKKYYDSHFNQISNTKDLKEIKLNLIRYENKLNIVSDYIIGVGGNDEKINFEKKGFLLQDSIYSSKIGSYQLVDNIIDVPTYTEMEKNTLYKDKNNIYYNATSRNSNYPYLILDLNVSESKILPGGYIKDSKTVYSYGGVVCTKIDSTDAKGFSVIQLKDTITNKVFYRGRNKKSIYWNESKMSIEDLKLLPIGRKQKDSLYKTFLLE